MAAEYIQKNPVTNPKLAQSGPIELSDHLPKCLKAKAVLEESGGLLGGLPRLVLKPEPDQRQEQGRLSRMASSESGSPGLPRGHDAGGVIRVLDSDEVERGDVATGGVVVPPSLSPVRALGGPKVGSPQIFLGGGQGPETSLSSCDHLPGQSLSARWAPPVLSGNPPPPERPRTVSSLAFGTVKVMSWGAMEPSMTRVLGFPDLWSYVAPSGMERLGRSRVADW